MSLNMSTIIALVTAFTAIITSGPGLFDIFVTLLILVTVIFVIVDIHRVSHPCEVVEGKVEVANDVAFEKDINYFKEVCSDVYVDLAGVQVDQRIEKTGLGEVRREVVGRVEASGDRISSHFSSEKNSLLSSRSAMAAKIRLVQAKRRSLLRRREGLERRLGVFSIERKSKSVEAAFVGALLKKTLDELDVLENQASALSLEKIELTEVKTPVISQIDVVLPEDGEEDMDLDMTVWEDSIMVPGEDEEGLGEEDMSIDDEVWLVEEVAFGGEVDYLGDVSMVLDFEIMYISSESPEGKDDEDLGEQDMSMEMEWPEVDVVEEEFGEADMSLEDEWRHEE
ncbi:hypothetical protein SISNIDRAFT_480436 [Sistotremastrum niveocremeum HHB9708]|uniref:Uncharacterized protein n=1 Tax=Sistotremastrum niveocremeum HHB9708 TaxID=1314777 RepID=A0A165ADL0_9AGAM|nr:hypothetical protein SISNIDRAFT_480436 [Sistotremastrum niveocremeum HHB9708]